MKKLIHLVSILAISVSTATAAFKELEKTDENYLISPDETLLTTSDGTGIKVYENLSLSPRYLINKQATLYSYSEDSKELYFKVQGEALYALNLKNGDIRPMIPHPDVMDVFIDTEQPNKVVFTGEDESYRPSLFKFTLGSENVPEKIVALKPIKGAQFRNDRFTFDPINSKLLHYAIEVSEPIDEIGERDTVMTRFIEVDVYTGKSTLLAEVNLGHSDFRWSQLAKGKIESDSTGYLLLDPYTGQKVLDINLPGINFGLDENPSIVYAKRTEEKNGVESRFYDIVQSGTLKTIHNFQIPSDWNINGFSPETAYDNSTQTQWFRQGADLIQIHFPSGKVVARYTPQLNEYSIISADATTIRFLERKNWGDPMIIYEFERTSSKQTKIEALPERESAQFTSFSFHPSKPEFFAIDEAFNAHFFQINRTGLSHQLRGTAGSSIQYSNDGSQITYRDEYGEYSAVLGADRFPLGDAIVYEGTQQTSMYRPIYAGSYTFSNLGNWILSCDTEGAYLHKTGETAIVSKVDNTHGEYPAMQFSPDDTRIAYLGMENIWSEAEQDRKMVRSLRLFIVDPTQEFLQAETAVVLPHEDFVFLGYTPDAKAARLLDAKDGNILAYDVADFTKSPKLIAKVQLPEFNKLNSITVLYDTPSNLTAIAVDTSIYLFNESNTDSDILLEFEMDDPVLSIDLLGNQRHLIAKTRGGTLNIIDTQSNETNRPIAKLDFYNEGEDYILLAANNQFDASTRMQTDGYIIKNLQPIRLSKLFEQNYEPNLIEQVFNGLALAAEAPEPFINAPIASIKAKQINALKYSLQLYAERKQYPLDTLSLYQNGKLIKTFKAQQPDRLLVDDLSVDLLLEPNTFTLLATDTKGTTSTAVTFSVDPPQAAVEAAKSKQKASRLHVLVAGINEYQNTEYNLNYAVADAESVLKQLVQSNQALFDSIETTKLTNREVTQEGLLNAFSKIVKDANPQDAFIFYYAGHGVMSQEDQKFYLVPTDVTKIYGPSDSLISKGISSQKLRELSESIRAQKQLFILDACNSAGALQAFAQRGASQEKAIAQLARSTGTHWIAASSSNQFATEFATLGHGAFTYTLLKALSGEADTGDKRITINELKAYLESELPNVTKEYKGSPQYPASYGYGQDFPVALLP
jgi:hypothetical protein